MLTVREKMLFNLGILQAVGICDVLGDANTVDRLNAVVAQIDLASPDISIASDEALDQYTELQKELTDTFSFLFHIPGCSCELPVSTLSVREKAAVRLGISVAAAMCEKLGSYFVLLPITAIEDRIDSVIPEIALASENNVDFYTQLQAELSTEMLNPIIQMQKDKLN